MQGPRVIYVGLMHPSPSSITGLLSFLNWGGLCIVGVLISIPIDQQLWHWVRSANWCQNSMEFAVIALQHCNLGDYVAAA